MADRPYLFYELTNSICSQCLRKVEAKIMFEDSVVFMLKRCAEHGSERVLVSTDEALRRPPAIASRCWRRSASPSRASFSGCKAVAAAPPPPALNAKRAFVIMSWWLVNQIACGIVLTLLAAMLVSLLSGHQLDGAQTLASTMLANVLATLIALDMLAKSFATRREMWSAIGARPAAPRALAVAAAVGCGWWRQ